MVGTMSATADFYKILQVDPEAERDVIRAAYVCLAKRAHPDAGGAAEHMVALNEAWTVLGNAERRAAYDQARGPAPARPFGRASRSEPVEHGTIYAPPRSGATTGVCSSTLDFGRYAGWTLEALAHEDPDYLEWLARSPGGRQYRTEISALFSARASVATREVARTSPRRAPGWRLPWQPRAAG